MRNKFDLVSLGILWDRLISITDEILATLLRTSFSIVVRESYDCSCVLFDPTGSSLAQGTYSIPSFTGTAPATLAHMLHRFPPSTLQPGDVIITNDPWQGTGHLFDINVVRPVFRESQLLGFTLSISHLPDIGGRGFSADCTEIYEEGLIIPICKLVKAGELNEELLELVRTNVRVSEMVIGDLMANITCNEVGGRLLIEFMDEYGIDDLVPLSKAIIGQSEKAMRQKIREMPDGVYENEINVEAVNEPATFACQVKIAGDSIHIDFNGTSPAVRGAVNVPLCYTKAFALYAIKLLTTPEIPNNEGSLRAVTISAPEGCILNPQPPSATGGRHATGHFVVSVIFGALAKAVPELVPADCGKYSGTPIRGISRDGGDFTSLHFTSGGFGALNGKDGASTTPGPSNVSGTPIEVWEDSANMTYLKKALLPDSGGAGKYRGGLSQEVIARNDSGHLMTVDFFGQHTDFPPQGINGGRPGKLRQYLINGKEVHPKARHILKPGDEFKIVEAGGGGYGDPCERKVEKVLEDVKNGFVTEAGALHEYGVKVDLESSTAQRYENS